MSACRSLNLWLSGIWWDSARTNDSIFSYILLKCYSIRANGNRVSYQVIWLCESLLFSKLSPVQLLSSSDVKEKRNAFLQIYCSWDLYYSTRLLCGEGTVGCHFGRIFENRFSPAAAAVLSTAYFLPVRNAAPKRVRAVYVSPICSVFLFVLFLPLPQNSKKGLVAWQVWCKRSAAPQLLPLLEQSCCFDSLWSAFSKYISQERGGGGKSVFSPNATCVARVRYQNSKLLICSS